MKKMKSTMALTATALITVAAPAAADGELNIYNWGNYTNPDLIDKFEEETGIDVTLTDYDSNDTALARIRQGGHGYDIVVPSNSYVPIWIEEGLLQKIDRDIVTNMDNIADRWVDVDFDPGRDYTVPWALGDDRCDGEYVGV
jgi:spermidine/putrescine transport system substrate-binding protein